METRSAAARVLRTPQDNSEVEFQGFSTVKGDLDSVLYKRRINALEDLVSELVEKFQTFEVENKELKELVGDVRKENAELKAKVNELMQKQENNEVTVKDNEKKVTEMNNNYSEMTKMQEEEKISLKEIMEQEEKTREENLAREVVRVIKEKGNMVRDTVDKKKCVVMYGLEEREKPIRHGREKEEKKWLRM